MAKHRQRRVDDLVMQELSILIREMKDPRIPMMTSVMRVSVTPDLKFAKAYISVMADEEGKKECIKGLMSGAGFIRREIGKRVGLRATPEFTFVIDDGVEHGAYISQKIADLNIPKLDEDEKEKDDEE